MPLSHNPCEHCGAPDKALWQTECRYADRMTTTDWSPEAWRQSGADAPCAMDAYDADVEERAQKTERDFLFVLCVLILAALAIGSLVYIFTR